LTSTLETDCIFLKKPHIQLVTPWLPDGYQVTAAWPLYR
jgi:hypothetical protein